MPGNKTETCKLLSRLLESGIAVLGLGQIPCINVSIVSYDTPIICYKMLVCKQSTLPSKLFPLLAATHFPFTYDLSLMNLFVTDVTKLRMLHC